MGTFGPQVGDAWFRTMEQRMRIAERHNHPSQHDDMQSAFLLRAQNLMTGGGTRSVLDTGIKWSSRFRWHGVGRHPKLLPDGVIELHMPTDGVSIPLHGTSAGTVRVVGVGTTATYLRMEDNDSLWYDLPVEGSANTSPQLTPTVYVDGLHVVVDGDLPVVIPRTWVRIVTRQNYATASPKYVWGDMMTQTA